MALAGLGLAHQVQGCSPGQRPAGRSQESASGKAGLSPCIAWRIAPLLDWVVGAQGNTVWLGEPGRTDARRLGC